MVTIKRFKNRKLYNTETSRYVTLEDIKTMVKQGEIVHVLDNESKELITKEILFKALIDFDSSLDDFKAFRYYLGEDK